MCSRLQLCRVLLRTGIRLQLVRSTQRHDLSFVIAVCQRDSWKDTAKDEPACFAETSIACWMIGWERTKVISFPKKALQENNVEFDRLVDSGKMADSVNDFMEIVKQALQPFLAKRPQDEEEWVIRSRAEVTTLRNEEMRGKEHTRKGGVTANVGVPIGTSGWIVVAPSTAPIPVVLSMGTQTAWARPPPLNSTFKGRGICSVFCR